MHTLHTIIHTLHTFKHAYPTCGTQRHTNTYRLPDDPWSASTKWAMTSALPTKEKRVRAMIQAFKQEKKEKPGGKSRSARSSMSSSRESPRNSAKPLTTQPNQKEDQSENGEKGERGQPRGGYPYTTLKHPVIAQQSPAYRPFTSYLTRPAG